MVLRRGLCVSRKFENVFRGVLSAVRVIIGLVLVGALLFGVSFGRALGLAFRAGFGRVLGGVVVASASSVIDGDDAAAADGDGECA